jgi:hypothetical protein
MAGEGSRDRLLAERIAAHYLQGPFGLELLRRPDESRDLVASRERELDNLRARSSVGAKQEQSHMSKTG